ncbi:RNA-processing protein [Methanocella sp. CWC-04]|uniref:RNA-processing protein n=1 Tax=Methanooceanicella nereidis TaxID=2052831 RepID=A0AAP2RAM0_9EURY|nr:KH domain-containing protein [Methanocella sp. CWC-04]MCD1293823.1 RNA-processing protein [Methanocella sp. CWC-04]
MLEHIKVPQDRIGVIIGPEGKIKEQIEKKSETTIDVDSESGVVVIESTGDPFKALKASETIKAIARGFSPDKAFKLLENEDLILDMIDISKVSDSPSDITRLKGRIIGRGGKTREIMESMTGAKISVYGKTISIIGDADQITTIRTAMDMLIGGAPHGAVYGYLERRRRELKRTQFDSIT